VDDDIAELVREERLLEAAQRASERGAARLASTLFERACDWGRAAAEALRAGDAGRALELAAESADDAVAEQALPRLAGDPAVAAAVATRLEARGRGSWAARVLEVCGRTTEAARAWEKAGEALRAATLFEAAGDAPAAARALEAALRRDPSAWAAAIALGALLTRFGKDEAALRVLQRVPPGAAERASALALLVPALERLGLPRAAADATAELGSLGASAASAPRAPPETAPSPPRATTRLFARYDVVREIASSPSARVLECVDVVRGERVAVKLFAAWDARGSGRDVLTRFEREARAMRALDHPNVVPLRDFVPEGPALILAWMEGGTLERLLASTGPLAPARAVEIAIAVLGALGDAHRLGVLHRDVKPSNILFDDAGGARLSDFGVAHLGDLSTTATAGVFGTLAYMSPEQREGRPATARSDVYAVGVVLREMLTGERPSPNEAPRVRPSEAHRELGPDHDAIVESMTAVDPRARPADVFEARRALAGLRWPATADTIVRPGGHRTERRSSGLPTQARVELGADALAVDTWTQRPIERVALSDRVLARARAFALADHPALQTVLRVGRDDQAVWLEPTRGAPLDRPLTDPERARLAGALAALHAAGVAHGGVDAAHVVVGDAGVVLRFEGEPDAAATFDRDFRALNRL
jgi:serine/threonine-protein kinase